MENIKKMNKLKQIWGYIVLVLGAAVGILLYALNLKNKKLEAAKARLALANTQKEVDLIESDIRRDMENREITKTELAGLQKSLDLIEEKSQAIKANKTDQEILDHWNKEDGK